MKETIRHDSSPIIMEWTIRLESTTFSTHPALLSSAIFSKSGANGLPACRIVMNVDDSRRIVSNRYGGDDSPRFVLIGKPKDESSRIGCIGQPSHP